MKCIGPQVWAKDTPLTFTEVRNSFADILILFASGNHGDANPFDGPSGTLAHAFYPPHGDVHFDNDENFIEGLFNGNISVFKLKINIEHRLSLLFIMPIICALEYFLKAKET